ncbi:glycoside hydrolase family protein [Paenibacillus kribbensis]|uniref:glycoside hydrolase family protein n=1 Tax=Paenibacillus kribbensis TaxID=172713 RepID=UPI002DBE7966|nr:glycoside hydrolase family protein [Paenibacillus kribbensis]MEC0234089.1 glycoside hydrolase family protein [Paenibacillus kribbensis]
MVRKISKGGLDLIKKFEGCRLYAYKPVATETYWTIGWGHYGPDVKQGMTITRDKADAMLVADLAKYEAYVNDPSYVAITDKLTQNQFDALTSFCYNCGAGNLKALCKGRTVVQIAQKISEYNKGGGNVLKGLVRRRAAELALYNKPDASSAVKEDEEQMDKAKFTINDKAVADGLLIDGTVYVPLRAVGDALSLKVGWDNKSKTASLTSQTSK